MKNAYSNDNEIGRTKEIFKNVIIENGEKLPRFYLKSDFVLLADAFEKFIKVSINEFDINPLYCISLPGYNNEIVFYFMSLIKYYSFFVCYVIDKVEFV